MSTPREIFEGFVQNPPDLGTAKGVFQFVVTGDDGGKWYVDSTGDTVVIGDGMHDDPGCTFTCADKDLVAMATGSMPSQMAFMLGKLRVDGDMMLAMQLQSVFG
ncbi:MAG: SCP2 sterol-binding domain-containing protein [Chloroflexota bacterium]